MFGVVGILASLGCNGKNAALNIASNTVHALSLAQPYVQSEAFGAMVSIHLPADLSFWI